MNNRFLILLYYFLTNAVVCDAQSTGDRKEGEVYARQKQIDNELNAKVALSPVSLPEPDKMVSVDQSGDGIISFPIVNVKGRKLSLPINITYIASGIKVDQQASEVGLGWNINLGSIVRDYGAFEPDYSYTGSEFKMLRGNGSTGYDKKLKSTLWERNPGATGWHVAATNYYEPYDQFKVMDYNMCEGKAPDNYYLNIPGAGSNDFWNSSPTIPAYGTPAPDPDFVFTEKVAWKISYETAVFEVSQEMSRINEFNYKENSGILAGSDGNKASAIALLPYVPDQQYSSSYLGPVGDPYGDLDYQVDYPRSPNMTVKYRDYSKFTITTSDGTSYVFGRALRGQKYLYSDEPFWSAMKTSTYQTSGATLPANRLVYNEFWKTDFIAEWLLTEIRSSDYEDVNDNGPDDFDKGDWIKIDYTSPLLAENIPGLSLAIPEPKHREFLNFTQTDRASSIWRERAYVTKITTPVETVDFLNSERFDVDHDYFQACFNRINNAAAYNCRDVMGGVSVGSPGVSYVDPSGLVIAPAEVVEWYTCVNYPRLLRKYDTIKVKDRADHLIQNIALKYAAKGSPQELAVSNQLILENDGTTFTPYNPDNMGGGITPATFLKAIGRGKTTLIGIDYRGSDVTSSNKLSYSFNYDYNPSYSDIHLFDIYKKLSDPTLRESFKGNGDRWTGIRTLFGGTYKIPNSLSPWKTIEIDRAWDTHVGILPGNIPFISGENNGNPVREDEFGYYYDNTHINKGRNAWSLSGINLPYGGFVAISYERDQVDINSDRRNWDIPDYCLPHVGHYNNVAHMRSFLQIINNKSVKTSWPFWGGNFVRGYKEFYFLMNENSGGVRLKQIDIRDNFGAPTVTKRYQYGNGHFTAPPGDYWDNYLKSFGEFVHNEFKRHGNVDENGEYEQYGNEITYGSDFSEYKQSMMRLAMPVRVDNSYRKYAKHYYEYIEELSNDNSKVKWSYGKLDVTTPTESRVAYIPMKYATIKTGNNDRYNVINLLSTDVNTNNIHIGNYATEMYNATGALVKKTANTHVYTPLATNNITTSATDLSSGEYYAYLQYVFERCVSSIASGPVVCSVIRSGLNPMPNGTSFFSNNFHFGFLPVIPEIPSALPYYSCEMYSGGFSTPQMKHLYEAVPMSLLGTLGYCPAGSTDRLSTTYNNIAHAKDPFLKIAVQSGLYTTTSGIPAWFSGISGLPTTWSGTYSDSWVRDQIRNGMEAIRFMNYERSHEDNDLFPHSYWRDATINVPATAIYRQKSFNLNSVESTSISNFY